MKAKLRLEMRFIKACFMQEISCPALVNKLLSDPGIPPPPPTEMALELRS